MPLWFVVSPIIEGNDEFQLWVSENSGVICFLIKVHRPSAFSLRASGLPSPYTDSAQGKEEPG